jgi:hypothetical protein
MKYFSENDVQLSLKSSATYINIFTAKYLNDQIYFAYKDPQYEPYILFSKIIGYVLDDLGQRLIRGIRGFLFNVTMFGMILWLTQTPTQWIRGALSPEGKMDGA